MRPTAKGGDSGTSSATTTGGGSRLGLSLLVIATAQLMVVLDGTIVNVALPQIQRALGFSGRFHPWVFVAAAIALLALFVAVAVIRVRREELTGAAPAPQEPASQPENVQRHEDRAALAAAVRPCRLC